MKFLLLALCVLVLSSCDSLSRRDTAPVEPSQPLGTERIDYDGLREKLGLVRPASRLGFEERSFDTCRVGNGYPSAYQCRQRNMGVLHFKLLCRDSTGTVSSVSRMDPLAFRRLKWEIDGLRGYVTTDREGHGQISFVSQTSRERSRLVLHSGSRYFGVRVGDLKMHLLPGNWCR